MNDKTISFHVEEADRSAGIVTEGFSASVEGMGCWCNLEDIGKPDFAWYDNDTGIQIIPPQHCSLVEGPLLAYANAWYALQECPPSEGPTFDADAELPTPGFERAHAYWTEGR